MRKIIEGLALAILGGVIISITGQLLLLPNTVIMLVAFIYGFFVVPKLVGLNVKED